MKFCRDCNTQNSNEATYCQCCGRNISRLTIIHPSKDPSLEEASMPRGKRYERVGGWLKLFVAWDFITMTAILTYPLLYFFAASLIAGAPEIALETELTLSAFSWENILDIFVSAISFVSTIMIIRKDSRFLLVRQIYYIVNIVYSISCGVFAGSISPLMIPSKIVSGAVVPFLMILYFCKSKRVNEFMESDEYKRKAILKF